MAEPYIGQLSLASWSFANKPYYALCNGQSLAINQYQAVFALLGTVFGGDGRTNFMLPNLQGRTPVGVGTAGGNTIAYGQQGGQETHTLVSSEVPQHTHALNSVQPPNNNSPSGTTLSSAGLIAYGPLVNLGAMNGGTLTQAGSGQAHENRQPYLVMNWLIALSGIFPTRG
jgi:microcystin-dependent protein